MKPLFLAGRALFGGFFLYSGIHHFTNHKTISEYAAAKGMPLADAAVCTTGTMLAAGGVSLMLGWKPRYGALAVAGALGGITPVMHDFWKVQDRNQKANDVINFSKNLALLGASLALAAKE